MSVNLAWKGKRFKTPEYKKYEKDVLVQLKPMVIPEGNLHIKLDVAFSNKAADLDNVAKLVIDILQKKYGFNDSRVFLLTMHKRIVDKGQEYIDFEVTKCE